MSHHSLLSRCEEISGNIEAMEDQSISFLKHLTTELREMEHASGSRLNGNLHNIKVTNKHWAPVICRVHTRWLMNMLNTHTLKGDQISLDTQRVKELFTKAGSQERANTCLAAMQMPEPSGSTVVLSFHQRRQETWESKGSHLKSTCGTITWRMLINESFCDPLQSHHFRTFEGELQKCVLYALQRGFTHTEVSGPLTGWKQGCQTDLTCVPGLSPQFCDVALFLCTM